MYDRCHSVIHLEATAASLSSSYYGNSLFSSGYTNAVLRAPSKEVSKGDALDG